MTIRPTPPTVSVGIPGTNKLETLWPGTSHLGSVQLFSHASSVLGDIAAEVGNSERGGLGIARKLSYSALGRSHTAADRPVASIPGDFVGYFEGQSNYVASDLAVFSTDFSGCLLVAYIVNGQRRVAHVAAAKAPLLDCKQAFLDTLHAMNAQLLGWFKPFDTAIHMDAKVKVLPKVSKYIGNQLDRLRTFGVITSANQGYAFDAFKPHGLLGNSDWIVTGVRRGTMSQSWTFH